jgi:hypothetical protein
MNIMYRYLEACREKKLMQSVSEGVDTLLMYLYRALNRVEDMERLASSINWCVVVCADYWYCVFKIIQYILIVMFCIYISMSILC